MGAKSVQLFTSNEMMDQACLHTSVMIICMSNLADMLKRIDRYSVISINPFTEFDLNIPIEAFLSHFDDEDKDEIKDIQNG